MPVLGHAFVGWATALAAEPRAKDRVLSPLGARIWVPAVVGLAYVPDAVSHLGLLAGWPEAPLAAHSLLFVLGAAPPLATLLAAITGATRRRAFAVAAVSLLAHIALDLLQSPDRRPLWPIWTVIVAPGGPRLPSDPAAETLLFTFAFLSFLAARAALARWSSGWARAAEERPAAEPATRRRGVATGLVIASVLALAATTHHLRNTRERELAAAAARLEQGDYAGALSLLDRAERWPSTARPGRIDDLRGQAWEGLGERTRAEASYLRAYRADPGYFWLVVDLAAFYASSDEPRNERRRRVSPLVQRLREEFANEPAMPAAVDRILRKLGSGT